MIEPPAPKSPWVKSSYSYSNGECIELAWLSDGSIGVRDSKHPDGAILCFSRGEVDAFIKGVVDGEFDEYR